MILPWCSRLLSARPLLPAVAAARNLTTIRQSLGAIRNTHGTNNINNNNNNMKRSVCLLLGATWPFSSLVQAFGLHNNANLRIRNGASLTKSNVVNLSSWLSSPSSNNQDNDDETVSQQHSQDDEYAPFHSSSQVLSARQARILAPLGLAFGSLVSPCSTQATETSSPLKPPPFTVGSTTRTTSPTATATTTTSTAFLPSIQQYFPQSLPTSTVRRLVHQTLIRRHYNPSNTLLATSICPDEINSKPHLSLSSALQEDLLGNDSTAGIFALGGLAGLPFAGISGLQALFSHVPRHVVILLAPHIGIAQNGRVGLIERGGTTANGGIATHLSTACGAAIGAGRKLLEQCHVDRFGHPCLPAQPSRLSFLDYEEDYIMDQLRPVMESMLVSSSSQGDALNDDERNARITTAVYTMSLTMFMKELEALWQQGSCPDHVEEITLLSGIIVNQGEVITEQQQQRHGPHVHHHHHAEDYFQPRLFQTWTKPNGGWTMSATTATTTTTIAKHGKSNKKPPLAPPVVDLFASTFGHMIMMMLNC